MGLDSEASSYCSSARTLLNGLIGLENTIMSTLLKLLGVQELRLVAVMSTVDDGLGVTIHLHGCDYMCFFLLQIVRTGA